MCSAGCSHTTWQRIAISTDKFRVSVRIQCVCACAYACTHICACSSLSVCLCVCVSARSPDPPSLRDAAIKIRPQRGSVMGCAVVQAALGCYMKLVLTMYNCTGQLLSTSEILHLHPWWSLFSATYTDGVFLYQLYSAFTDIHQ